MDRLTQILGENKSRESVNSDTLVRIILEGKEKLLPPDEINKIVDAHEQFNKERQSSPYYRILGTINPLVSNPLFNTSGANSWEIFNNPIFLNGILTYPQSLKQNLKEVDGWFGYFDPIKTNAALCNYYDMEPKRERFTFVPNANVKNWDMTITYPASADTTHNMVVGGLLIIDTDLVSVGGRPMVGFATPVQHNLVAGDIVRLTGTTVDGTYEVKRVGLDNGDLAGHYFCLDVNQSAQVNLNSRMAKLISGVPSQYYFRKFKKIKTRFTNPMENDDYEVYNLAFGDNIFSDNVAQFVINEDIDVSDLTDNLGRPLSELYLTIIKTSSNGIFSNVSTGLEMPFISNLNASSITPYLRLVPTIQKIHNGGNLPVPSHTPLESNININTNLFYGDVVEYHPFEAKETILGEVHHRFNTLNREGAGSTISAGPRQEGYYYKAHQLIRIRDFSNYVEQGDSSVVDMPDYKVDLGDGRYLWRDLLDHGTNDVKDKYVNHPFLNGCHYIHQNYNFDVRRQDPFDNWDLYYSTLPADPIGNTMNNKYKINPSSNAC